MYDIYVGKRIVMKGVALLKFPYHEVEQTFKQIARKHHMIPNQLQAILWFTWKRIHNVKYNAQTSFLRKDHWGIEMHPSEIIPYATKVRS
jgi:hypothetical protein